MGFGGRLPRRLLRIKILIPVTIVAALLAVSAVSAPKAEALDSEESNFLAIINQYRSQNGLAPLAMDSRLNDVARWMAEDMASNNYFSHTDSQGRDPFVRMDQLGYAVNTWRGENLVAGTTTAQVSFDLWRGSPGHNANMLGANYTVIGVARAYDAGSTFGWYWATEFGGDALVVQPPPQVTPEPAPYIPPPLITPEPQPVAPYVPHVPVAPIVTAPPPPAPTIVLTPAPTPVPMEPWWHALSALDIDWIETPGRSWVSSVLEGTEKLGMALNGEAVATVR